VKPRNMCRRLLIALAAAFVLSAWLYALATIHTLRPPDAVPGIERAGGLLAFFRDKGTWVLALELVGLAVSAALLVIAERHASRRRG